MQEKHGKKFRQAEGVLQHTIILMHVTIAHNLRSGVKVVL